MLMQQRVERFRGSHSGVRADHEDVLDLALQQRRAAGHGTGRSVAVRLDGVLHGVAEDRPDGVTVLLATPRPPPVRRRPLSAVPRGSGPSPFRRSCAVAWGCGTASACPSPAAITTPASVISVPSTARLGCRPPPHYIRSTMAGGFAGTRCDSRGAPPHPARERRFQSRQRHRAFVAGRRCSAGNQGAWSRAVPRDSGPVMAIILQENTVPGAHGMVHF